MNQSENHRFDESNNGQLDDTLEQIKFQRMDLVDMITDNKKKTDELANSLNIVFKESNKLHQEMLLAYKDVSEENQSNAM